MDMLFRKDKNAHTVQTSKIKTCKFKNENI